MVKAENLGDGIPTGYTTQVPDLLRSFGSSSVDLYFKRPDGVGGNGNSAQNWDVHRYTNMGSRHIEPAPFVKIRHITRQEESGFRLSFQCFRPYSFGYHEFSGVASRKEGDHSAILELGNPPNLIYLTRDRFLILSYSTNPSLICSGTWRWSRVDYKWNYENNCFKLVSIILFGRRSRGLIKPLQCLENSEDSVATFTTDESGGHMTIPDIGQSNFLYGCVICVTIFFYRIYRVNDGI